MKIDLKTIKDLAENIDKYNLNEVVIESEGAKVTLKKEIPAAVETVTAVQRAAVVQNVETAAVEEIVETTVETEEMETINSPMVGTFYKSCLLYTSEMKIIGKPAHAGISPENGINALTVASHAIKMCIRDRGMIL